MNVCKTILYIDDDADDRELLRVELTEVDREVKVKEAQNGSEGLNFLSEAVLKNQLPCLIVLDLNMPVLDGRQTFHKIHNELHLTSIPLVVYTSSSNPKDESFFTSHGVRYFVKPSTRRAMKAIAEHMISACAQ